MSSKTGSASALKRGLYGKNLSPQEQSRGRKMPFDNLHQEIIVLRVIVARLLDLITEQSDMEKIDRVMVSLATVIKAITSTLRAQAALTGNHSPLDEALADALAEEPFYIEDNGRDPGEPSAEQARDEIRELWDRVFDPASPASPETLCGNISKEGGN